MKDGVKERKKDISHALRNINRTVMIVSNNIMQ